MVAERKLKKNSEMSKKVVETDKVVAESETKIKTESVVEETTSLDVQEQTNVTTTEGGVSKKEKEKEKEDDYMSNPVSVYISKLNNYVERITTMNKELKELVNVGKSLEKDFNNIVKVMSKKSKNKSSEKRHPSGFAVPYKLSNELYTFLNINNGDKVPRNDVTRMINEYITSNSLRDENDRRIIKPNTELHKIFNSTNKDSITYFNLQSYIKHHFIKEKV
jgi:chromatin remodeling complex protein RSC6